MGTAGRLEVGRERAELVRFASGPELDEWVWRNEAQQVVGREHEPVFRHVETDEARGVARHGDELTGEAAELQRLSWLERVDIIELRGQRQVAAK